MSDEKKKDYDFGGLQEFSLEEIENEVLNDTTYLDVFAGSDLRVKENIEDLSNTLNNINNLSCIKFDYKDNFENGRSGKRIGLIAQEVAQFYPEAVAKDQNDTLYVNYQELVPVLLQSIKDLSKKVDEQEELLKKLTNN